MKSIYFQAIVREVEHPFLHKYLSNKKGRGASKKFVCDAAEERLRRQEREQEETQDHAELIQRLDEIRQMLRSGVRVPSETVEELKQESSRVKDSLRALIG